MAGDYIGTFGDGRNSEWVLHLPIDGAVQDVAVEEVRLEIDQG